MSSPTSPDTKSIPNESDQPSAQLLDYEKPIVTGDVVKIGEHRHLVRNVVPPDKEKGIVGWIEFDPNPVHD